MQVDLVAELPLLAFLDLVSDLPLLAFLAFSELSLMAFLHSPEPEEPACMSLQRHAQEALGACPNILRCR